MNPIGRIKAWLERRDRRRRQLQMLEMTIREDWRWLSPDPIARELTSRYMLILDHHWHLRQHETAAAFRERVLPAFKRGGFFVELIPAKAVELPSGVAGQAPKRPDTGKAQLTVSETWQRQAANAVIVTLGDFHRFNEWWTWIEEDGRAEILDAITAAIHDQHANGNETFVV